MRYCVIGLLGVRNNLLLYALICVNLRPEYNLKGVNKEEKRNVREYKR